MKPPILAGLLLYRQPLQRALDRTQAGAGHLAVVGGDRLIGHRSAPVLSRRLETPNLNTEQTLPVNPQTVPPAASKYRVAVSSGGYEPKLGPRRRYDRLYEALAVKLVLVCVA